MIIHLEVEWDDAILERFALVIAQQSVHFALQLNWILQGALQDYQPEQAEDGAPNPNYNPLFYTRCLKLLKNVERCVVYGKPRAQELQRLYERGKITKKEMHLLEQADRRFNALQITAADDSEHSTTHLDGWVQIQGPCPKAAGSKSGTSEHQQKQRKKQPVMPFVNRFCKLERHVLNCYKHKRRCCSAELVLDRALSLDKASMTSYDDATIKIDTLHYTSTLKFESPEEKNLWFRRMSEEAVTGSLLFHPPSPGPAVASASIAVGSADRTSLEVRSNSLKSDLTPAQLNRYEFFQNERAFVENLTGIAEALRFEERAERKKLAPPMMADLQIPSNVYLPLCNSSDIWRRVSDKLADHTRVFNTKERCPVVMHFVSKRGEPNTKGFNVDPTVDVAEYMHLHFEVLAEDDEEGGGGGDGGELSSAGSAKKAKKRSKPDKIVEEDETDDDDNNGDNTKGREKDDDSLRPSEHLSTVWDNEEDDDDDQSGALMATSGTSSPKGGESGTGLGKGQHSSRGLKGNKRVQRLLRESVVKIPDMLAKRMKAASAPSGGGRGTGGAGGGAHSPDHNPGLTGGPRRRARNNTRSVMDRQTEMQPNVVILEGEKAPPPEANDDMSVGSVGQSSVLVNDHIVMGLLQDGDIDAESIARATDFVCGGKSWAQTSAEMLESAQKVSEELGDTVAQLEIASCLAKSNDDLRQEVFIMQMIHYYKSVFHQAKLPIYLKTYRILSTGSSTGLLELLTDATSLDALKKSEGFPSKEEGGLRKYFLTVYGGAKSKAFKAAQKNFMQSLVGYSIVSYLLGLKDRHNGNIMIDTLGHLIFIDFGFAMGMKVRSFVCFVLLGLALFSAAYSRKHFLLPTFRP